jgi:hypothetical protein
VRITLSDSIISNADNWQGINSPGAPSLLHSKLPKGLVQVVMNQEDVLRLDAVFDRLIQGHENKTIS